MSPETTHALAEELAGDLSGPVALQVQKVTGFDTADLRLALDSTGQPGPQAAEQLLEAIPDAFLEKMTV